MLLRCSSRAVRRSWRGRGPEATSAAALTPPACLHRAGQVLPREGGGCVVEHVLAVKPLVDVPPAVAPYTSSIFKQQVAGLLRDLAGEAARLTGGAEVAAAEAAGAATN